MGDEKKKERKKFDELPYEEKIKVLEEDIEKTKKYLEKLKKAIPLTKKKLENLENQKKAIMYDNLVSK